MTALEKLSWYGLNPATKLLGEGGRSSALNSSQVTWWTILAELEASDRYGPTKFSKTAQLNESISMPSSASIKKIMVHDGKNFLKSSVVYCGLSESETLTEVYDIWTYLDG